MAFLTSEPAFDFLRTKNTLGYVCFTMAPVLHDYAGFSVIVGSQREKFTVEDVYGKMLEFHQHFLEKLEVSGRLKQLNNQYIVDTFKILCSIRVPISREFDYLNKFNLEKIIMLFCN